MLREMMHSSIHYHAEYMRRHVRIPEPLERPPSHELRRAIGLTLIQMGERLAGGENTPRLDRVA